MKKYYHPRIEEILLRMYKLRLEYYVHFFGFVDFYKDDKIPTMGVTLHKLNMAFVYNEKFLLRQDDQQLIYLMIHELYHLLFRHPIRNGSRNHELANTAQDMIINHLIDTHYCIPREAYQDGKKYLLPPIARRPTIHQDDLDGLDMSKLSAPVKVGDPSGCTIPDEYLQLVKDGKATLIFEELYDWLLKTGRAEIKYIQFDTHGPGKPLDDIEKQLLSRMVGEASEKAKARSDAAGSMPGFLKELMELDLKRPRGNNLREISKVCAALRGSMKESSYRRRNRKVEEVKGFKRVGHALTVGWDWSGSMYGRHEAVARELFRDGYELHVIGADTQVGNVFKVTRKEQLKRIPFNGGGGTILQPMVDFAKSTHPYNKNPLVILTDGEIGDPHLNFSGFKHKVLILTTNVMCKTVGGNVKQIKIKNDSE